MTFVLFYCSKKSLSMTNIAKFVQNLKLPLFSIQQEFKYKFQLILYIVYFQVNYPFLLTFLVLFVPLQLKPSLEGDSAHFGKLLFKGCQSFDYLYENTFLFTIFVNIEMLLVCIKHNKLINYNLMLNLLPIFLKHNKIMPAQ